MENIAIIKKAKAAALQYWLIPSCVMLLTVIVSLLIVIFWDMYIGMLILFLGMVFLPRMLLRHLYAKHLEKPYLNGEFELFCRTARAIGFDNPRNALYVLVLDLEEKYQELINVCVAQIKRLRGKKRPSRAQRAQLYHYLFAMTRCYYRLGDMEKTAQLCATYREWLGQEKAALGQQIEAAYPGFSLYEKYLAKDAKGCLAHLNSNARGELLICSDMMIKARVLSELQGDVDGAMVLYEEVQNRASANIRSHALREAENLANNRPYGYGNEEILPQDADVLQTPKKVKRRRALFRLYTVFLVLLWIVPLLLTMPIWSGSDERDPYADVLHNLQQDYPDVEVLSVMEAEQVGGYVYVGVKDDKIAVGTFAYEGIFHQYYDTSRATPVLVSQLKDGTALASEVYFRDLSQERMLIGSFYETEESIPVGCPYTELVLDEKTYYFALLDHADMYWIYVEEETIESMYIRTEEESVVVGYTYHFQGDPEMTFMQKVHEVSMQELTDPAYPLLPALHTNVTGEYRITGCFYRREADIPETAYAYYSFELPGHTCYYAVLSVE